MGWRLSDDSGNPPHEADKDKQNDRAGGSRHDLSGDVAAWEQTKLRQQPASQDSTDDADHDIPDDSKAVPLDDDAGQEARDRADEQQDQ
jgi:hypothetical protein